MRAFVLLSAFDVAKANVLYFEGLRTNLGCGDRPLRNLILFDNRNKQKPPFHHDEKWKCENDGSERQIKNKIYALDETPHIRWNFVDDVGRAVWLSFCKRFH